MMKGYQHDDPTMMELGQFQFVFEVVMEEVKDTWAGPQRVLFDASAINYARRRNAAAPPPGPPPPPADDATFATAETSNTHGRVRRRTERDSVVRRDHFLDTSVSVSP